MLKELVLVIVNALVDSPEDVVCEEKDTGKTIVLTLHVAAEDMGRVIGRQGRIAKSIRSILKAAATGTDKKVVLDIADD